MIAKNTQNALGVNVEKKWIQERDKEEFLIGNAFWKKGIHSSLSRYRVEQYIYHEKVEMRIATRFNFQRENIHNWIHKDRLEDSFDIIEDSMSRNVRFPFREHKISIPLCIAKQERRDQNDNGSEEYRQNEDL